MNIDRICAKCSVAMYPKKNGVYAIYMFQNNTQPYQIWSGDLWACHFCDAEIINGWGSEPMAEHFQDHFNEVLEFVKGGQHYFIKDNL